ncbi:hypothetical protein BDZ91DRAFT_803944 [Kalaharituber pfeilii]|nr:hypothetical protein BDZ91DRAFT_803944 [Kalaharituber pfeilii]
MSCLDFYPSLDVSRLSAQTVPGNADSPGKRRQSREAQTVPGSADSPGKRRQSREAQTVPGSADSPGKRRQSREAQTVPGSADSPGKRRQSRDPSPKVAMSCTNPPEVSEMDGFSQMRSAVTSRYVPRSGSSGSFSRLRTLL